MNADEIVRDLRAEAQFQKDRFSRFLLADAMFNAADLIESLQAQLAASQRRADAAVEFIKYLDRNYSGYMAEDERFAEWRGEQSEGQG